MVKKNISRIGEAGSLMIEALAMLGLISMVTPIIYKKAAERNSEIQDVNSAAQIRNIIRAADDYTRENHSKITAGNTIPAVSGCPGSTAINFGPMGGAGEKHQEIPIANLCAYLPYGFLDSAGNIADDRIFGKNYKLIIKKADGGVNGQKVLTNFLVASPKQGKDFAKIRTSRIASMIGSNGGFINERADGSVVGSGVQGMWEIADLNGSLGITVGEGGSKVPAGSIISSSVQPISTGGGADHLLHRYTVTGKPELNRMYTNIDMNENNLNKINQAVITGVQLTGTNKDKALSLTDGAGAYITGVLAAADGKFAVDSAGALKASDGKFTVDSAGALKALDGKFTVDATKLAYKNASSADVFTVSPDGTMNLAKDANIGGNAVVKGTLKVDKTATIGDGNKTVDQLVVKGSAHVQGNLKVDDRFSATSIDAGTLRAGTVTPHSTDDKAYTLKVDSSALMVKDSTGADKFIATRTGDVSVKKAGANIFNVDQASAYTTVNGLKAGTIASDPALQVVNTGATANDVVMNLVGSTNKIIAYDDKDKTALLLNSASSTLQKVNATNNSAYSNFEAREGYARTKSATATDESFLDVKSSNITMDVNKATTGVNVGVYKPGVKGTRAEMWLQDDTDLKVITNTSDPIFHVDTATNTSNYVKNNTGKGSVYVRRGAIEVASGVSTRTNVINPYKTAGGDTNMGHIKADTFISNEQLYTNQMVPTASNFSQGTVAGKYDTFMVNPAYTSVMHDIKLTTRGGARLSDILPDFINKGIYVVDNTYAENKNLNIALSTNPETGANGNPTSPWVGLVPAPQCPPGYQKVITAMPSTFAMAQAGYPITKGRGGRYGSADFEIPTDSYVQIVPTLNDNQDYPPEPLYFQKSTWLKTKIYPVGADDAATFEGWNILLGFVYPKTVYVGGTNTYVGDHKGTVYDDATLGVYWNLYPVFEKELEAFVNTYCYFARARWNNNYVDSTYNQLTASTKRPVQTKTNTGYNTRLNDPNLKYDDVW